ncbi:MAG: hypothetical protein ACLPR9_09150 [Acidimicrobiales bacterium]
MTGGGALPLPLSRTGTGSGSGSGSGFPPADLSGGERRARGHHARQRPDRAGLQAAEPSGGDPEGDNGAGLDAPGAIGDGGAVEGDHLPGSVLDRSEPALLVELGNVAHQRGPAHGHQAG